MNLTPDRQGYLGDLMSKSLPQLWELLQRQERLLSQRKLLEQMPDHGEKTKNFAALLRKIIEAKTRPKGTVAHEDLSLGIGATAKEQTYSQIHPSSSGDRTPSNVHQRTPTVNGATTPTADTDSQKLHISDSTQSPEQDDTNVLISGIQNLIVGTEQKPSGAPKFENSYERVIKKKDATEHHQKFLPNRPLNEHHQQRMEDVQDRLTEKKESRYEESAVHPPPYKHSGAKLISIEESIQLIEEQRKRNEELAAERAAAKLAEQFSDRMSRYNPDIPDMGYRETEAAASDLDSDDEEADQREESNGNLEALDGVD